MHTYTPHVPKWSLCRPAWVGTPKVDTANAHGDNTHRIAFYEHGKMLHNVSTKQLTAVWPVKTAVVGASRPHICGRWCSPVWCKPERLVSILKWARSLPWSVSLSGWFCLEIGYIGVQEPTLSKGPPTWWRNSWQMKPGGLVYWWFIARPSLAASLHLDSKLICIHGTT